MPDPVPDPRTPNRASRRRRRARGMLAVLTAGVVYQTSGCQVNDVNTLAGGLAASVAASFVTNYVNELFGVSGGGGF